MYHAIDPVVIARHQLSHELARRILVEKPDPPRVILSTQDRLSTRQFKVATRIHPTPEDSMVRVKHAIHGRRVNLPLPDPRTLVKVAGDGYCAFRALMIASGVRYRMTSGFGVPIVDPEVLRTMLYGLWSPDHVDYFDGLPGVTEREKMIHSLEYTHEDRDNLLEQVNRPNTWCGPIHMHSYCRVTDTDMIVVHGEAASTWFSTRELEGRPERALTVKMPLQAITHADAYTRQLNIEDVLWRVTFDVFSRVPDRLRYDAYTQTRQVIKLAELLEHVLIRPSEILEFGAAPGQWYAPLTLFSLGRVQPVSPVGPNYLLPNDANFRNVQVIPSTIENFSSVERYSMIVSDAATDVSWLTNDTLVEMTTALERLLAENGTLIVKVSNYTLTVFEAQYATIVHLFRQVLLLKPKHSRAYNTEAFIVAQGYRETPVSATDLFEFVRETGVLAAYHAKDYRIAPEVNLPRMLELGILTRPMRVGGDLKSESEADETAPSLVTVLSTGRVIDLDADDASETLASIDHPMVDTFRTMLQTDCKEGHDD